MGDSLAADTPPPSRVVDRVVAVVEGQVITQSELEFEARVMLLTHGAVRAAVDPLDDDALRSALELSINQRLQVLEADKLRAFPLERAELEGAVQSFRARFESQDDYDVFFTRWEADEGQVVGILERSLRAEKVLDSKLRLRAQISEPEVRAFYDKNAASLGKPYLESRQSIREKLFRDRYAAMAVAELATLREKADIRTVAPMARQWMEKEEKR